MKDTTKSVVKAVRWTCKPARIQRENCGFTMTGVIAWIFLFFSEREALLLSVGLGVMSCFFCLLCLCVCVFKRRKTKEKEEVISSSLFWDLRSGWEWGRG